MKIALVSTDFLPNIGGVPQHEVEIAKALLESGDEVEVITIDLSSSWKDLRKQPFQERTEGFSVWRIPFVINRSIRFVTGQISSRISERLFGRELLKRLNYLQPDVVHWHVLELRGHPLAEWSGSAKVWTNHTSHFVSGVTSTRRIHYQKEAALADEIIAPSEELCELTAGLGVSQERIHFIPNGVDSSRFQPNADSAWWRKKLAVLADEKVVLCPRRLAKKNGVSYFVRAAVLLLREGLADTKFVISGDFEGPRVESEEALVAKLIADSGFETHFCSLGRVENKDMPGLYACSDLVVMPSLIEATSLSAMEAMAAGKPLVSTNVGGLPFLIRDGENGILVPPCQANALADAMRRLLDSPAKRTEFGKNGRTRVEMELDWKIIARRTKEIYGRAIERHCAWERFSPITAVH
jgi:glycosyltransferase involved in cell wall biosynthesis